VRGVFGRRHFKSLLFHSGSSLLNCLFSLIVCRQILKLTFFFGALSLSPRFPGHFVEVGRQLFSFRAKIRFGRQPVGTGLIALHDDHGATPTAGAATAALALCRVGEVGGGGMTGAAAACGVSAFVSALGGGGVVAVGGGCSSTEGALPPFAAALAVAAVWVEGRATHENV
jgi:hypothetical protein